MIGLLTSDNLDAISNVLAILDKLLKNPKLHVAIHTPDMMMLLAGFLKCSHKPVQLNAIHVLLQLLEFADLDTVIAPNVETFQSLIELLDSSDADMKRYASDALMMLSYKEINQIKLYAMGAHVRLNELAKSDDPDIKWCANQIIANLQCHINGLTRQKIGLIASAIRMFQPQSNAKKRSLESTSIIQSVEDNSPKNIKL